MINVEQEQLSRLKINNENGITRHISQIDASRHSGWLGISRLNCWWDTALLILRQFYPQSAAMQGFPQITADTYQGLDNERGDCSNMIINRYGHKSDCLYESLFLVMGIMTPWHNMTSRDTRDMWHWVGVWPCIPLYCVLCPSHHLEK